VRSEANPFTNPGQVRGALYASADRIVRRTGALHRARVTGRHAGEVICDLAGEASGADTGLIADLGCGRGTTTRMLAERLPSARVIGADLSAALLVAARQRLTGASRAAMVRADFHQLPFPDGFCNLVVAAFCLYHARSPASVIAEIARCLVPGGTAIIAVKSADSYRELDQLIARSRFDPAAETRPSLYQAAHSGNIESLAAVSFDVRQVIHETHRFVFPTLAAVAEYLSTSTKYDLPPSLAGHPAALAAALRQRTADEPVTATSVVTYLSAIHAPAKAAP
jgi:ubiquinone/menaquinone biosynthesis C-methylase UbiE